MSSSLPEKAPAIEDDSSGGKASDDHMKRASRRKYRINLASLFWCFFMYGINDGTLGPLLPVYQRYYKVSQSFPLFPLSDPFID